MWSNDQWNFNFVNTQNAIWDNDVGYKYTEITSKTTYLVKIKAFNNSNLFQAYDKKVKI